MVINISDKIILGITGASGIPISLKLAEELSKEHQLITVVTESAKKVMEYEAEDNVLEKLSELSSELYTEDNMAASISSGSNKTKGMVIAPCSMKTLGSIANGISNTLVSRAADVCLKEKRKLVLVPRESPLSTIHLENMTKLSKMNVDILPPILGFYYEPQNIDDVVDHVVGKVLERFEIEHDLYDKWDGE